MSPADALPKAGAKAYAKKHNLVFIEGRDVLDRGKRTRNGNNFSVVFLSGMFLRISTQTEFNVLNRNCII